jgi:hypothetical protein
MNQQERRNDYERNRIAAEPTEGRAPVLIPSNRVVGN